MTNENDLIDRLRTEADLCRNETATDIADLLDEAAREIGNLHRAIWCAEVNCSDGIQAGIHLIARLRIALADAIRRPMGVIPDSAEGLVSPNELQVVEYLRPKRDDETETVMAAFYEGFRAGRSAGFAGIETGDGGDEWLASRSRARISKHSTNVPNNQIQRRR